MQKVCLVKQTQPIFEEKQASANVELTASEFKVWTRDVTPESGLALRTWEPSVDEQAEGMFRQGKQHFSVFPLHVS